MSKLQKELEETLREIKVVNNVIRFLNLLISFKEFLKSKQTISLNTFGKPNTEVGDLLDNLKSLFDPTDDFSKNAILKGLSGKLKKQGEDLNRLVAHCGWKDLKLQTLHKEGFSKNVTKKQVSGKLKQQEGDFTDVAHTQGAVFSEKPLKYLDDARLPANAYYEYVIKKTTVKQLKRQSFPTDDFSKNAIFEKALKNIKRQTSFTDEFLKSSTNVKTFDTLERLAGHSDVFSETDVEKVMFGDFIRLRFFNFFNDTGKKLLEILKISEQNSQLFEKALLSLLYALHGFKKGDLSEPLNEIIKETENIITVTPTYTKYNSYPPFHKDTDSLNILRIGLCISNRYCDSKAEEILNLVLRIGSSHSDFSIRDKAVISIFMIDAISPIELYIKGVYRTHRNRSYSSIIRKRSALQIIIDDYAKCTSTVNVSQISEYQKITKSIELIDRINKNWCDDSDDSESGYASDKLA